MNTPTAADRTITLQEVIPVLLAIKAEKRDHTQDICSYTYTDETEETCHCVVGAVLNRLGVPLPEQSDYYNERAVLDLIDFWLTPTHGVYFPSGVANVLTTAQVTADGGGTWGQAVDNALAQAEAEVLQ